MTVDESTRSRTWDKVEFALLALLLFAPLLISGPVRGGNSNGKILDIIPPRIHKGDEPHYLLQINSLLNDRDLDLANNYAAVQQGQIDAGQNFRGSNLAHHVCWYINGRHVGWFEIYETRPERWNQDASGARIPTRRADADPALVAPTGPEYSYHPPWLAIGLAPILYPVRGSIWVESLALFCSAVAVVLGLACFRSLVRPYLANPRDLFLLSIVTFLGTPIWHYGRTLFTEPYVLFCTVGAYAIYLRRERCFWAGVLIAVATLLKPSSALLAVPLGLDLLIGRRWRSLALFCIPFAAALIAMGWLNHEQFGSVTRLSLRLVPGNPLTGALGLLFSTEHGLLPFAPAAIAALAAWPRFVKARRREGIILLSAVLLQFGFIATLAVWNGGSCYGPRYLIPVLPLLFAAAPIPHTGDATTSDVSVASRRTVLVLYGLSILTNLAAVSLAGHVWNAHPASESVAPKLLKALSG